MIHAQRELFDERNPVLLCLLGLASVAGGLGTALAAIDGGRPPGAAGPATKGDDPVLALLGAVAVAASLGGALRESVRLLALESAERCDPGHPLRGLLA